MLSKIALSKICSKSLIVFDLTGTLFDFGAMIPFIATKNNLQVRCNQYSDWHIRRTIDSDDINQYKTLCKLYNISDFQKLFIDSSNNMIDLLEDDNYFKPTPGAIKLTHIIKNLGIKIGIISNYSSVMTPIIKEHLNFHDFKYDNIISRDATTFGPPTPWLLYRSMEKNNTYPLFTLYVGDTYNNVLEGFNAKVDTLTILDSSNEMGYSFDEFNNFNFEIKEHKRFIKINNINKYNNAKYYCNNLQEICDKFDLLSS